MKRIKFTSTVQYENEGRNQGPTFNEGTVHDFPDEFADKWLRRNVATLVDGRTPLNEPYDLPETAITFDHDGDGKPGGSLPAEPPALSGKNKSDLLAIAEAEGVEIEEGATNDDIRSAIELAREAND